MPNSEIKNTSMNDDARTFTKTITVPDPRNNEVVYLCAQADFAFDIIEVRRKCSTGRCDVLMTIQSVPVTFVGGTTSGAIHALNGALATALPNGSASNHRVAAGNQSLIQISNVSSGCGGLVYEIKCRATQVDTA